MYLKLGQINIWPSRKVVDGKWPGRKWMKSGQEDLGTKTLVASLAAK